MAELMYKIKKDGAWYCVITESGGIVQFRSTRRGFCVGWIEDNSK